MSLGMVMVVKIFTRPTAKAKKIASATAGAILLAIQYGSLASTSADGV
jgi:hypothetical protein